ncbi:MAG: hypothetical protein FIA99_02490 [Ruminiclostridium sp.]|nr:hypothetical protein [Ruminiclostridium sp.]
MNRSDELINQIIELKKNLRNLSIQHWLNFELFTWVWWVEIIVSAVVFFIWLKVVDKSRIRQIVIYGLLIDISAVFLDILGSEFALWEYLIRIIPQIPLLYPVDFIIHPVGNMIVYQCFVNWKKYLIAGVGASAVLAFILEPLSTYMHQYRLITWKYYYSFPIYLMILVFSKFLTDKIVSIETKNKQS